MYNDSFFILISFICLIAFAFKTTKFFLSKYFDDYANSVSKSIADSEAIKKEAEAELEAIKTRAREISVESYDIVSQATDEAKAIIEAAQSTVEDILKHKTQHMLARIARHEDQIHAEIKAELITHVLKNVEAHLSSKATQKSNAEVIADSLDSIKKILH